MSNLLFDWEFWLIMGFGVLSLFFLINYIRKALNPCNVQGKEGRQGISINPCSNCGLSSNCLDRK